MFCRQVAALVHKNIILKIRRWPETLWELVFPFVGCGFAGILAIDISSFLDKTTQQYVYTDQTLFEALGMIFAIAAIFMTLSFFGTVNFCLHESVFERQTYLKEALSIMSMQRKAYHWSYMLGQGIFTFITCCLIQSAFILANSNSYKTNSNQYVLFGGLLLFGLNQLIIGLLVSTIVRSTQNTFVVSLMTLLLPMSLSLYLLFNRFEQVSNGEPVSNGFTVSYMMPNVPFYVILAEFYIEGGAKQIFDLNLNDCYLSLAGFAALYYILYWYLDNVVPHQEGQPKSLLFCCVRDHKVQAVDAKEKAEPVQKKEKKEKKKKVKNADETSSDDEVDDTSSDDEDTEVRQPTLVNSEVGEEDEVTIECLKLSKSFDKTKIIEKLDLTVKRGEVICLLGHSGAGKSVLLKLLTGEINATKGDAQIKNMSIRKDLRELRLRGQLGVCYQQHVAFPKLTVQENLRLAAQIKLAPAETIQNEVEDILKHLGLGIYYDRRADLLSDSMKRRLQIAMAVIGGSKVVILDEPTEGLDSEMKEKVWDLIYRAKQRKTVFFCTRDLREAEDRADRILILSHGKIAAEGTPQQLRVDHGIGYNIVCTKRNNQHLVVEQAPQPAATDVQRIDGEAEGPAQEEAVFEKPLDPLFQHCQQVVQEITGSSSVNKNLTDENQVAFVISAEMEQKIPQLLKQLEKVADITVTVQKSSFFEIYERVVKQIQPAELDHIVKRKNLRTYRETTGRTTTFSQTVAVFYRRMLEFSRSSQQWFTLARPIIFIMIASLLAYALYNFGEVAQMDNDQRDMIYYVVARMIPFAICGGYMQTNPLFMTIVQEKERETLHILRHCGMQVFPYWLGLFLADYILFTVQSTAFILVAYFIGLSPFVSVGTLVGANIALGPSFIVFSYVVSQRFQTLERAVLVNRILQVAVGLLAPMLLVNVFTGNFIGFVFFMCYLIFPLFTCFLTLFNQVTMALDLTTFTFFGTIDVTLGMSIGIYVAQFVVYSGLLIYLEQRQIVAFRFKDKKKPEFELPEVDTNTDVKNHEKEIKSGNWDILAQDVTKTHSNGVQSVAHVSFGVKQNQIVGIVGPTGCGKTSLMKMLQMEQPVSGGKIKLMDEELQEIEIKSEECRRIGLISQRNMVWEFLTVNENLRFIARIEGLSTREFMSNSKLILQKLEMTKQENVLARHLSQSDKRKLAIAMTLLIRPSIELLDGPCDGMDPWAKRGFKRALNDLRENAKTAVLMTSGNISDLEPICDKILIMVNGRFVTYGSPQYLKETYGDGYELTAIVDINKSDYLDAYQRMQDHFENAATLIYQGYVDGTTTKWQMTFKVPLGIRLSRIFETLCKMQKDGDIESYDFKRMGLEQIYKAFSRFQHSFDEKEKKMVNKTGQQTYGAINLSSVGSFSVKDTSSQWLRDDKTEEKLNFSETESPRAKKSPITISANHESVPLKSEFKIPLLTQQKSQSGQIVTQTETLKKKEEDDDTFEVDRIE